MGRWRRQSTPLWIQRSARRTVINLGKMIAIMKFVQADAWCWLIYD
jgi:hypothetical protein